MKKDLLISYTTPVVKDGVYTFTLTTFQEILVSSSFKAAAKEMEYTLTCLVSDVTTSVTHTLSGDANATDSIQIYESTPPARRKNGPKIIIS